MSDIAFKGTGSRHRDGGGVGAAAHGVPKIGRSTMMLRCVSTRRLLLAASIVFAAAGPASAPPAATPAAPAAPAAAPKPGTPGAPNQPLYGRPDSEAAMKLAPVAPPPLAAARDKLPVDRLKLPKGFHIEVFASGIPDAR